MEPDVEQERESVANLLEELGRDVPADRVEPGLHLREPRHEVADRHRADVRERLAGDADGPGLGVQPVAATGRALDHPHVLLELHPPRTGGRLLEAREQLRDDPLPRPAVLPHDPIALLPFKGDVLVAGPEKEPVAMLLGQLVPRRLEVDAEGLRDPLVDVLPPPAHAAELADQRERPVVERQGRVRDEEIGVERVARAEPVAVRAHALRTVEAEELRGGGLVTPMTICAGVVGGEEDVFGRRGRVVALLARRVGRLLDGDDQGPVGEGEGLFDRLRQSRADARLVLQAVDDDLDVVLDSLVEAQLVGEADEPPVHPGADVAALEHVREEVLEFPLLSANDRGENEEARLRRQGQDAVNYLLAGLGGDRPAAVGAMSLADSGVEHAEEVRDLSHRADRGPGVAAGGLLLDADGRRQAADVIDIGLGQLAEELTGVARQGFDVPPLPLGVEGVEREGRFPGPTDPGKDDQRVAGQGEIDAAEVMLPRTANDDLLVVHYATSAGGKGRGGSVSQFSNQEKVGSMVTQLSLQRRSACGSPELWLVCEWHSECADLQSPRRRELGFVALPPTVRPSMGADLAT